MYLPDLLKYRLGFTEKGGILPLKAIIAPPEGMLVRLPLPPEGKTGWPWLEESNPAIYRERNNWPKLTIVSPSYNQAGFLEQTIRSVLLQNYPNLEYIIIDGGSTDGSKEILEKYSPWISYWQCEKDKGQGNAINLGFSLSSGTYHAWINSDDYYLKNIFHQVIMRFLNANTDFVYGYGQNYHLDTGRLTETKVLPLLDFFIKIPSLVQPSAFWSARIHQPVWEELHCAMDYELWLRLVKGHKRSLIRESLSVANIHDGAKTSDPKMKAKWEEDHQKIWAADAHGTVHEWKRIVFFNRIRAKIYQLINRWQFGR
jgi:glycosyltransferase involved in cell wall biosynthesis